MKKQKRSYGRLQPEIIVKELAKGNTLVEAGKAAGSKGKDDAVIANSVWRKIHKDVELQQKIKSAIDSTHIIAEKFEDEIYKKLISKDVEMSDKDMVDSIAKLHNATVNLHKAYKLERGEATEFNQNPQQVILINNLYQNLQ